MPRCAGSKPSGEPCKRIVKASQTYCFSHDPARQDERKRNASRAGKSKPNRELAAIKERLSDLADGVIEGDVDKGVAAVASQVLNVYLRAIATELKVKEVTELEARLGALEGLLAERQDRRKGRTWD